MASLLSEKPFRFDVQESLKTGLYVSGTTGCGKSDVAMYCADELRKQGVTLFVFDPSQDWSKRYPIKTIYTFKNPNGISHLDQVKLQDGIFDTSTLTVLQYQELADKFCWLLFKYQAELAEEDRKQFFIIFEEAQILLPQGSLMAKRLQNVVRLLTIGRNYKVRMGVITQFASMVDKNSMRFMSQKWFGWTDEYNDVRRIGTMLGDEEAENLKYYKSGEFTYYFPRNFIQEKISIKPYK